MAKPSVLLINRVYPPMRGATGRVMRDLAHAMAQDGWDVTILTTGKERLKEKDGPVHIHRIKTPTRSRYAITYLWIWIRLFFAALKLPSHHLIITMTDPPMLVVLGRILARMRRCRHVHWCQDLYPDLLPALGVNLPGFISAWLKKLSRRSMKSCDRVVVIGRCMARQLTHSGVEPARVSIIPNWPDVDIFNGFVQGENVGVMHKPVQGARPPEALLKDDSPKFRVLYAGNLGRAHPVGVILDAAQRLSEHHEIQFVFVGDSPGHEKLAKERTRRGLENIKFLPFQPPNRLRSLLESGDLHLVTMREGTEGLLVPCKFYSALAVARPCLYVGPKETEIAQVIQDFHAGAIIPPGDGAGLAQAILHFRHNEHDWFHAHEGAGQAGQNFVPNQSIGAWLTRARESLRDPI